MRQISVLIKPASSICNMQCAYCFYKDEVDLRNDKIAKIMDKEAIHAIVDQTMRLTVEHINYCFQGGEPTLAGIGYFNYFVDYVSKKNNGKSVSYSIQTNGLLLDETWMQLFSQYHFLVGVSMDGFKEIHDLLRKDNKNQGTFDILIRNIKEFQKWNIDFNILTVLTHQLAKYPKELYHFYIEHQLNNVQLIPCLPSLNENENHPYALKPRDFASFYKGFFDCWKKEKRKISVTLFDNIMSMYLGIAPQQCGMIQKCFMQYVIEADGSVYPCDFYALDQYECGNIKTSSLKDIFSHKNAQLFLSEKRPVSRVCKNCRFYKMCYGYCKRMNVCIKDDDYCGYQDFLNYSQEEFVRYLRDLRNINGG